MIITLPASVQEVANSPEAASILSSLQSRVSRVGADTQPVAEDEIYEVIRRRLSEDIGDAAYIEKVANRIHCIVRATLDRITKQRSKK